LTDGLEVGTVLPQTEAMQATEIVAVAAGVAAAGGCPWGRAFPAAERVPDTDGAFDGETATAEIGGVRYFVGPVADPGQIPAAVRLKERGCYLLELRSEEHLLGIIALQPRLATGVGELVETCERRGVEVPLLDGGTGAARWVARRAGVTYLDGDDAAEAVRTRQRDGKMVALVSDSAHAAAGFAACDLAIGLTSGQSINFPARADLLAPGLGAVAAIVEAGARRDAAFRDAVLLSMVANVFGTVWGLRGAPRLEHAFHAVYLTAPVYATALAAMGNSWARLRGGKRQVDHPF
jgi:cation-transporting P-type ATPase I